MASLKFIDVCKYFDGGVQAVKNFNLDISDREFVVLVGPSGCGKSTTLRMVAGLEDITSGQIFIDGNLINHVQPKDRNIAMVFQNYALYPHMNVYKNMAFGLKLRHYPKHEIDRRVKEAADILGIGELLDRKPKELSGGQMQRVAVGRAIVRNCKVYLFDEPLSNLDAKMRVEMRAELNRLHNRLQATMIYVTHDQVEAMTLGDRIVIMLHGLIQQVDTPINIYDNPANKFVGGFIGSPPMNFLEGRIEQGAARELVFVFGENRRLPLPRALSDMIKEYLGKEVFLGTRPEDISDKAYNTISNQPSLTVVVEVIERLGNEIVAHATIDGCKLIFKEDAHYIAQINQKVEICLNMDKVHIFDKETEKNITIRDRLEE